MLSSLQEDVSTPGSNPNAGSQPPTRFLDHVQKYLKFGSGAADPGWGGWIRVDQFRLGQTGLGGNHIQIGDGPGWVVLPELVAGRVELSRSEIKE